MSPSTIPVCVSYVATFNNGKRILGSKLGLEKGAGTNKNRNKNKRKASHTARLIKDKIGWAISRVLAFFGVNFGIRDVRERIPGCLVVSPLLLVYDHLSCSSLRLAWHQNIRGRRENKEEGILHVKVLGLFTNDAFFPGKKAREHS